MFRTILKYSKIPSKNLRCCSNLKNNESCTPNSEFKPIFSFPFIRYFSVVNRLKVYQIIGTSIAFPGCGILETLNYLPSGAFLSAAYIGITGTAVISLATLPFRNIIGFIYISNDDKKVKISYLDFWGRRKNKLVPIENWTPLLEMNPKVMDAIYLSPQLSDGTKYKLFIKFGKVLNSSKMGQLLE